MYTRSSSMSLTVQQESFAYSGIAARNREPEVFTFERIPTPATAVQSYVPIRSRKRCTRVMYPAKVRMHLPPPEKSQAKRWLVILCLVVLWQIYTEEADAETPVENTESRLSEYKSFPFQSTDELARRVSDLSASSNLLSDRSNGCDENTSSSEQLIPNTTCPESDQGTENSRPFERSAGKSYMVALLVYHRLGSDN
ncbi:radiation-inducible immediate-early gene IEX-1 [Embiotoca jacksoni]|uniref:radiation-inducible immediate-early gene IEX-1 n=1 Tax=Embiotoca jacksoni TaxID=100190 RepID=UPI0037038B6B